MEYLLRLDHKSIVYGVAWSPFNKNIIVTGCRDSIVRLYDITKSECPVKTFKGHKSSVFNVVWHPQFDYILASGSDDFTIRIWDTMTVME